MKRRGLKHPAANAAPLSNLRGELREDSTVPLLRRGARSEAQGGVAKKN